MKRAIAIAFAVLVFPSSAIAGVLKDKGLLPAVPPASNATTVSGRISKITRAPSGELQSFTLDNGIAVRLPPHPGARADALVQPGHTIVVDGLVTPTSDGSIHLDATSVGDPASAQTAFVPGSRTEPPRL